LPEPVGHASEPLDLRVGLADLAQLQQGHQPEPAAEELQLRVGRPESEPDDRLGLVAAAGAGVRTGDDVGVAGQRVSERPRVVHLPGHGDRGVAELATAGLGVHEGQGHRQPGEHPRTQHGRLVAERGERLLEQLDLRRVEQLHLEAAEAAPEA
jgi:hypothetical protein